MLYHATHSTRYVYDAPVAQCLSEARLTPRVLPTQDVRSVEIRVEPEPAIFEQRKDYFGNDVTMFTVFQNHDHFTTTASSIVEVRMPSQQELPSIPWEEARDAIAACGDEGALEAYEFVFDSPFIAAHSLLHEYGVAILTAGRPLAEVVMQLSARIHEEFRYRPKSTSIDMPLMDVLKQREGVCQDFAHVMIGVLRSWGLAARYVSGYLRSGQQNRGAEASHAWVAVFVPGYGWMNIDPTNNVVPTNGHITLAWGRDYGDVTPVRGIALGGGGQAVQVEVRVEPIP